MLAGTLVESYLMSGGKTPTMKGNCKNSENRAVLAMPVQSKVNKEMMTYDRSEPSQSNGFQAESAELIIASYQRLIGRPLDCGQAGGDLGDSLYSAPSVVLAHDMESDPVFFYANRAAQQLFEMAWEEMVRLPSRLSAEPLAQDERQRLLGLVSSQGYIDDYSGVRVSRTGKRFLIERATVWNLMNGEGKLVGQAAAFRTWLPLTVTAQACSELP